MNSKPLGEVAKVIAGQSPASSTYNSTGQGLPFFQGKADFQEMYPKARMWCTSDKRKIAEAGDILISVRAPVGAVNICNQKSIIGRGLSAIRPFPELNGMFLYYFLIANEERIDALGTGSTFKAITQATLKKIEIPLPPLSDQIRIAHLLGKVEGLITQRKQHLQQLDDLLKSVFLEMFGDPVRNEKGWDSELLVKLVSEKIGYGIVQPGKPVEDGVPTIRVGDFIGTRIKEYGIEKVAKEISAKHKNSILKGDEILLACVGATIGKVALVGPNHAGYNIVRATARIRASKIINRLFLLHFLLSDFARNYYIKVTRAVGQPTLNIKQIEELNVITPPIALQNKFATFVEKVEALKSRYQQSLNDLESLYGALSQQAFNGELDLSRVPSPDVQADSEAIETTEQVETPVDEPVAIDLPDTDYLLDALTDYSLRERLLADWLESYCQQIGKADFSTDNFLAAAQTRIAELHPDNDFELGAGDYEIVKGRVFEALQAGTLTQSIDEAHNLIRLNTGKPA
ncbi:MAG: restriction endonuclease subunit S [Pseudomonadales bacterium]|nr:restriction endonuclease subunit S [Pseudomonadales bacterium]